MRRGSNGLLDIIKINFTLFSVIIPTQNNAF